MKQIYYALSTLLFALLIISCTVEQPSTIESTSSKSFSPKTKGSDLEGSYHYWYQGESIPLTLNLEYINILLSNPEMDEVELDELCQEMHLRAFKESRDGGLVKVRLSERPDSQDEYITQIHAIRTDSRINGVYPFFERGGGAEPIGTSNVFYLKLRDEEGYFDLEPMQQFSEENKVNIVKEVPYMPDWYVLSIENSVFENSIDATNNFYESGLFADVDPAFMFNFQPCTVNDPYYFLQWGLKNTTNPNYDINVEGAWNYSTGSGIKVAVVDQGIETSHSDLAANIFPLSYNAQTGTTPSVVYDAHGTHVAGIIAAVTNNNNQIAGIAYNARLLSISHNLLPTATYSSELAGGITWARQNGADVINCSWGDNNGLDDNLHTSVLEDAIVNAMTLGRNGSGSIVVFSAGNGGQNNSVMDYPATFDDRILTAGAIDISGFRASFSSYGTKLDVVAPGEQILSTYTGNVSGLLSGTSMAAPHVSGVAALMIAANPDLTREEVVRLIEVTAKKIHTESYQYYSYQNRPHSTWNQEVGYGLIDATKAVSLAWHKGQTNPSNNPAVEFYIPIGATTYSDGTIVINSFPTIQAFFYVPTSLENMSYTYYWYYTLSGDPYWSPTYYIYGYTSGIQMTIPRPNSNSILSLTCEVFNGSTYVCTVHRDFHVLPNFPS